MLFNGIAAPPQLVIPPLLSRPHSVLLPLLCVTRRKRIVPWSDRIGITPSALLILNPDFAPTLVTDDFPCPVNCIPLSRENIARALPPRFSDSPSIRMSDHIATILFRHFPTS